MSDPAQLVARILSGESAAEAELVTRFGPGMAVVLRRAAGARVADDLYQETFRVALQRIRAGAVAEPARLAGFLCGVARNLALEHFRRQTRHRLEEPLQSDAVAERAPSPLDRLLDEEKLALVREVMAEMDSERDRQLLRRFYLGEEDKDVLCRDLGLTSQHFNRVLFRARQRYRELYERRVRDRPPGTAPGVHSSRRPAAGRPRYGER